ncbi:MAG: hypothetical protein C5B49_02600, partial [Bdellovibrio sp.]
MIYEISLQSLRAVRSLCAGRFIFVLVVALLSHVDLSSAGSITPILYQARILQPDGTPLEAPVTLQLSIRSPTNCILWLETHQVDMTGSKGAVSLEFGAAGNESSGNHSFKDVFNNALTFTNLSGCSSGNYTPGTSTEDRFLAVSFNDGVSVNTLPNIPIRSVPYSHYAMSAAQSMGFLGSSIDTSASPSDGQVLAFNAVQDKWTLSSGGIKSVSLAGSSAFSITGGPVTSSGTLNIDFASQGANLFLASPNGGGVPTFRAMTAADVPNLPAAKITSGTLSAAVGGTGLIPAALNANQLFAVNAAGTGTEFKSLMAGSGVTVDTSTPGQITISSTSSAGGTVTDIGFTASSLFSVTGSPITSSGSFNLDLASQAAGKVLASPVGSSGVPSFRTLDASDVGTGIFSTALIPNLSASKITSGTLSSAVGGTGLVPAAGNANSLYGVNAGGSANEYKTLLGAGGVSIDTSIPGQITITGSGGGGGGGGGSGSVTDIGLTGSSLFDITGGPISTSGTFNIALSSEASNLILASPNGSSGVPTFRALDGADIGTGTLATARLGLIPQSSIIGGVGTGTVTGVVAGTGLSGGTISTSGTIALANTSVTATTYGSLGNYVPWFVVNAQGQLTSAGSTAIDGLDGSTIST